MNQLIQTEKEINTKFGLNIALQNSDLYCILVKILDHLFFI